MSRMIVKVLDVLAPGRGYMAEVPNQPGRYVKAPGLPELKSKLKAAMADPDDSKFASSSWSTPITGCSETALFITL